MLEDHSLSTYIVGRIKDKVVQLLVTAFPGVRGLKELPEKEKYGEIFPFCFNSR